jgi:hypothetical protein
MRVFYYLLLIIHLATGANMEVIAQINLSLDPGIIQQNPYHRTYTITVAPNAKHSIFLLAAATSMALQINATQNLGNASVISGKDTFLLTEDIHAQENNITGRITSNLIIFPRAVNKIEFYTGALSGEVVFHLLNAGESRMDYKPYRSGQSAGDCSRPATIGQNVWRAGLPVPAQMPDATQVEHIIVHHSATSNAITDYTSAVRNIYLYHTQVNGWNDIGYNFLIAPDGTIFEGRDGRERIEEDNVMGAHFCAKNRGTMGVCLLGTFTSVAPTQKAQEALVNIASWKMDKETLDPLNSAMHPLNTGNATLLGVMAGHRDGCSTECPGTVTYSLLPRLRMQVKNTLDACQKSLAEQITIYPQPAGKEVFVKVDPDEEIRSFTLYDVTGKLRQMQAGKITASQIRLDTRSLAAGMYILRIQLSDSTSFTRKVLVL